MLFHHYFLLLKTASRKCGSESYWARSLIYTVLAKNNLFLATKEYYKKQHLQYNLTIIELLSFNLSQRDSVWVRFI